MKKIFFVLALMFAAPCFAADAELVIKIIECESSGRFNAVGDDGLSYGIAQFRQSTFNEMKALAKMPNLRYKNPIHQLKLMNWMLDNGFGNRWTCYRKMMYQQERWAYGDAVMDSIHNHGKGIK